MISNLTALLTGKPMYGLKICRKAKIPKPLRGKNIPWRMMSQKYYIDLLKRLKLEHDAWVEAARAAEAARYAEKPNAAAGD
jgi:hypothetical protein